MRTETQRPDPAVGYTWGESDGSYFVRNPDGDFRQVSENAMKLLEALADGEMTTDDLDGGALRLAERLEDEGYFGPNRPVERIVTPSDIALWPRSVLFFILFGVVAYTVLPAVSSLGTLSTRLSPSRVVTVGGLLLTGVAVHESGHHLAAREYLDPSFRIQRVNGVIPTVTTNTSGAWILPKNRRRWISLAGPFAELLWVLGVVVYDAFLPASTALELYLVAALTGFAFTLNPLIHGDGYWLLVDTFGVVNLRKRGLHDLEKPKLSLAATYVAVSYLFGIGTFVASVVGAVYAFGPKGLVPISILLGVTLLDGDRVRTLFEAVAS
ncbi:hypothetical protein [Halorussus salinus]|uniref:hypothetical protein n=1 Tax=Halorussus salinus TaxID=1364935 RepID=UPI0010921391|nr:hypothetical protein [Halorussus salinus]